MGGVAVKLRVVLMTTLDKYDTLHRDRFYPELFLI
jgi:hypothetical protein